MDRRSIVFVMVTHNLFLITMRRRQRNVYIDLMNQNKKLARLFKENIIEIIHLSIHPSKFGER